MEDKLLKDLFLGFIKVHILHHAAKERIYGQEFSEELQRHGYQISYGTLYPLFHKLERKGKAILYNNKKRKEDFRKSKTSSKGIG